MIIDSHQHFWSLNRGDYPWPDESVAPIFRDFGPNDLAPLLAETGVDQTVVVQATDTVAETEHLLDIAEKTDFVAGVVGWVDLSAPDAVEVIDRLRANLYLKGIRPMLQNIEDTNWILHRDIQPALIHMQELGLCFDALIQPRHLAVIDALAERYPSLPIVVDHAAKLAMRAGDDLAENYRNGITTLANRENVYCKLSGMVTEVGPDWRPEDILPVAHLLLDAFGPRKLMFGSDWPVVNLAADYVTWVNFVDEFLKNLPSTEKAQVFGGTAKVFYGI